MSHAVDTITDIAIAGGLTGIVIQANQDLIIDPTLILAGVVGFTISNFTRTDIGYGFRFSGLLMGVVFANFGTAGLVDILHDKGLSNVNPHLIAVMFGFTGLLSVEISQKIVDGVKIITPLNIKTFILRLMGINNNNGNGYNKRNNTNNRYYSKEDRIESNNKKDYHETDLIDVDIKNEESQLIYDEKTQHENRD